MGWVMRVKSVLWGGFAAGCFASLVFAQDALAQQTMVVTDPWGDSYTVIIPAGAKFGGFQPLKTCSTDNVGQTLENPRGVFLGSPQCNIEQWVPVLGPATPGSQILPGTPAQIVPATPASKIVNAAIATPTAPVVSAAQLLNLGDEIRAEIAEYAAMRGVSVGVNGGGGSSSRGSSVLANLDPTFDASGNFAGGEIGYNWPLSGRIVAGFAADLQAANIGGSLKLAGGGGNTATANSDLNWFGTLRGKLGSTFLSPLAGPSLIYLTGGLAFGGIEDKLTFTDPIAFPPNSSSVKKSETAVGYVLGAGVEVPVARSLFLKTEYLYVDLGSDSLATTPLPSTHESASGNFTHTYNTFRVGLNYHIPSGAEPLK
jgi:outer membrane immunogenic protein